MSTDLYVTYLSGDTTEDDLRNFLASKVIATKIYLKPGKLDNTKVAFVSIADQSKIDDALSLHQQELKGKSVCVKKYIQKHSNFDQVTHNNNKSADANSGIEKASGVRIEVVSVTHTLPNGEFYVQIEKEVSELGVVNSIMETLGQQSKRPVPVDQMNKSFIYGAPYEKENSFYRARIVDIKCDKKLDVFFIDYGNVETINESDLFLIPRELSAKPALAHLCKLHNIEFIDLNKVLIFFNSSVLNNICEAHIFAQTPKVWSVDLVLEKKSLCELMLKMQVAKPNSTPAGPSGDIASNGMGVTNFSSYSNTRDNGFPQHQVPSSNNYPRRRFDHESMKLLEKAKTKVILESTVVISHIQGINEVFVQGIIPETVEKLTKINDFLLQIEANHPKLGSIANIKSDGLYVTRFSADDQLYRCSIIGSNQADGTVLVCYVDYGNTETKRPDSLIEIPPTSEACTMPWLAQRCYIPGVSVTPQPGETTQLNVIKEQDLVSALQDLTVRSSIIKYTEGSSGLNGHRVVDVVDFSWDVVPSFRKKLLQQDILKEVASPMPPAVNSSQNRPLLASQPSRNGQSPCASSYQSHSHMTSVCINGPVTHLTSLDAIWLQRLDKQAELTTVSAWMMTQSGAPVEQQFANVVTGPFNMDTIYGGLYKLDNSWYRCQVLETGNDQSLLTVFFVDFGNQDKIDRNTLVHLPTEVSNIIPLAYKCSIDHLLETVNPDQLNSFLAKTLQDQEVMLMEKNGKAADLMIMSTNQSVVQMLLNMPGLVKLKQQAVTCPPAPDVNLPMNTNTNHVHQNGLASDRSSLSTNKPSRPSGQPEQKKGSGVTKPQPPPPANANRMNKPSTAAAKRTSLPTQKQSPTKQSANVPSVPSTQKLIFTRIKLTQYRSLFGYQEVSTLPESVLCLIGNSAPFTDMWQMKERIEEAHSEYLSSVKAIKNYCEAPNASWDGIGDLLAQRNSCCAELKDSCDTFSSQLVNVEDDLTKFRQSLKDKLVRVTECSSLFPGNNVNKQTITQESITSTIDTIKMIGDQESLKQLISDTESVQAKFKESMDVFDKVNSGLPSQEVSGNLTAGFQHLTRMEEFMVGMSKEINHYTTDGRAFTGAIRMEVGRLLKHLITVINDIVCKVTNLNTSVRIFQEYSDMCHEVLTVEESPEQALKAAERVKHLRSQLRHKLADLEFADESNSSDPEVEVLKSEVENLREELQAALVGELEACRSLLSTLDLKPELVIKYKSLNLSQAKDVFRVWDLSYFNLSSMDESLRYQTNFNGNPVIIKKVIQPPADLATSLTIYGSLMPTCTHLLPVDFAFHPPREDHAVYLLHRASNTAPQDLIDSAPSTEHLTWVVNTGQSLLNDLVQLYTCAKTRHGCFDWDSLYWTYNDNKSVWQVQVCPPIFPLASPNSANIQQDCAGLAQIIQMMWGKVPLPKNLQVLLVQLRNCRADKDALSFKGKLGNFLVLEIQRREQERLNQIQEEKRKQEAAERKRREEEQKRLDDELKQQEEIRLKLEEELALESALPDSPQTGSVVNGDEEVTAEISSASLDTTVEPSTD